MATVASVREELVTLFTTKALYASLHSSDPGSTGAGEIVDTGRKALVWTLGASDGLATTAEITFNVSAGTSITHVGLWTAASGGTFVGSVFSELSFNGAAQYITSITYAQA